MNLVDELMDYYRENMEDFANDIQELDAWNGCIYDDRVFPMDDLNNVLKDIDPLDIVYMHFYGYDEPINKNEQRQPFNPNRNYFYFNGYGNLVSTNKIDYSDYLDSYFIQDIIDNRNKLSLSCGAEELIDNYEEK